MFASIVKVPFSCTGATPDWLWFEGVELWFELHDVVRPRHMAMAARTVAVLINFIDLMTKR